MSSHLTPDGCQEFCNYPICLTAPFLDSLKNYDLLIRWGIRRKAWDKLRKRDVPLVLTSKVTFEDALNAYLNGTLRHEPERILY